MSSVMVVRCGGRGFWGLCRMMQETDMEVLWGQRVVARESPGTKALGFNCSSRLLMASRSRWLSYTVLVSGHVGTRVAAHGVGGCSWHHVGCRGVGGSGTHLDDRPLIALVSIGPQRPVPDGAISHLLFRESLAHLGGCIPLLIFFGICSFAVAPRPRDLEYAAVPRNQDRQAI